ncbi:MAG: hypothetical protein AAF004_06150 [Pseudomonadota bacterium]
MFKAIRIFILLVILLFVALDAWLSQLRSTDWNNSLWVTVYPINTNGGDATDQHIRTLSSETFESVERFFTRETERYGVALDRPVRIKLGPEVNEQPPALADRPNVFSIMLWSLRMRWWAGSVTDGLDDIAPDIKIFVRYHVPAEQLALEDSIGVQKGMYGIVNAFTGRASQQRNNVVIAHELLHTIGASDKYLPATNQPLVPIGLGEPGRVPLYPQRVAEIMGGRIALTSYDAVMPDSLKEVVIGPETALEIGLRR